jgi:hypothetical protein
VGDAVDAVTGAVFTVGLMMVVIAGSYYSLYGRDTEELLPPGDGRVIPAFELSARTDGETVSTQP